MREFIMFSTMFLLMPLMGQASDIERPLSIKGLSLQTERAYLNGVADGFQVMNAELGRQEKARLYCMPPKLVLLGRDLLEFAPQEMAGPQQDVDVVISALFGLMKKYPCPQSIHGQ